MDFVYEEGKGWLIDNMYFDDYNGKVLKLYSEYNEYQLTKVLEQGIRF